MCYHRKRDMVKKKILTLLMCTLMLSLAACSFDATKVKDGQETKTEKDKDKKKDKDKDKEKEPVDDPVDEPPVTELPIIDGNLELIELYNRTYTDYGYSDNFEEEYVHCTYNLIYTSETAGMEFSALSDKFMEISMDRTESAGDYISQSVEDVKYMIETSSGYAIYPYYDESYQDILRSDERVVSLAYYNESYMGGAHGMYGWNGQNFDPRTGENIKISDVIFDVDVFNAILKEKFLEYDPYLEESTIDTNLEAYKSRLENGEGGYNWSIDYYGITVYFNPYEMGSYAQGAQQIRIKFEDYPELFNDYYAVRPYAYMMGGDPFKGIYTDIDGDGEEDEIYIAVSYADDLYTMNITIGIDDESYSIDMPGYGIQSYIAHMADDKEYIMLSSDGMSGSYETKILSFENNDMFVKEISDWGLKDIDLSADPDDYKYAKIAPSDPYYFLLGTRVDLLGTYIGRNWFSINEDGCLESYSDCMSVTMPQKLVIKTEIEVYPVDEYGMNSADSELVLKGTEMEIVGTDGENYVDVDIEGATYRIFVEIDDNYEQYVNGISIYDVFETVYFAG